ncbi:MAG: hypothetical protein WA117_05360 [Verrucomicrobiia bacterium]
MKLTHLLALIVAVPSTYTVYQKLSSVSPQSVQGLAELDASASSQTQGDPGTAPDPASTQPSSVSAGIRALKPADWVRGLPVQAQTKYFEIQTSLRRDERIHALRFWMSLWNRQLRDPYLTLVELDFLNLNLKNRSPVLYSEIFYKGDPRFTRVFVRPPDYNNKGAWKQEFLLRVSALDSLDNMLRSIRVRSASHPALSEMIGEFTDKIAKDRTDLMQYKHYCDDSRLR